MELKCTFELYYKEYRCIVTSANIVEPNVEISRFKGVHATNKTNLDVQTLIFKNLTVHRLPTNLAKHFPCLRSLVITNCGLKKIKNEEIRGLVGLISIKADGNQLKRLHSALFQRMQNIEKIDFSRNQIETMSSNLILPIYKNPNLRLVDLSKNKRIDIRHEGKTPNGRINVDLLMKAIDASRCFAPPMTDSSNLSGSNSSLDSSKNFVGYKAEVKAAPKAAPKCTEKSTSRVCQPTYSKASVYPSSYDWIPHPSIDRRRLSEAAAANSQPKVVSKPLETRPKEEPRSNIQSAVKTSSSATNDRQQVTAKPVAALPKPAESSQSEAQFKKPKVVHETIEIESSFEADQSMETKGPSEAAKTIPQPTEKPENEVQSEISNKNGDETSENAEEMAEKPTRKVSCSNEEEEKGWFDEIVEKSMKATASFLVEAFEKASAEVQITKEAQNLSKIEENSEQKVEEPEKSSSESKNASLETLETPDSTFEEKILEKASATPQVSKIASSGDRRSLQFSESVNSSLYDSAISLSSEAVPKSPLPLKRVPTVEIYSTPPLIQTLETFSPKAKILPKLKEQKSPAVSFSKSPLALPFSYHSPLTPKVPRKLNLKTPEATDSPKQLQKYFAAGKESDFTIRFCQKEYQVHKSVLASQSYVFSSMFKNEVAEGDQSFMNLKKFSQEAFDAFIGFFYHPSDGNLKTYAMELYELAAEFQVLQLTLIIEKILLESLDETNALEIFNIALAHRATKLKQAAFNIIKVMPSKFPQVPDGVIDDPELVNEIALATRHLEELYKKTKKVKFLVTRLEAGGPKILTPNRNRKSLP